MPVVPTDPVLAFWTADVRAVASEARLTAATLTIRVGGRTETQDLTVDRPVITLAGGSGSADQRKVSGNPAIAGCSLCAMPGTATLALTFDVDGASIPVETETSFGCVY
jgi:hypothetical protein